MNQLVNLAKRFINIQTGCIRSDRLIKLFVMSFVTTTKKEEQKKYAYTMQSLGGTKI